jgi:hypothetical protein
VSLRDRTGPIAPGWPVIGRDGGRIGTVDGVFVDYLLVRSASILPIDLYIPADAIRGTEDARVMIDASTKEAKDRWRRPLRKAPHDAD